jgi:soluble lytic murein transglycosylase
LERAIDAFTLCFRNADTAEDRHRAAWYAADCAVRLSPAAGLASLIHWVTICDDPAWFGDILVSFGSSAVLAGRWGDIGELFRSVGHRMDAETRSFFLFVLSRAYAAGFLVPGPGDSSASFLRRIRAEGGHPYYVLMAAALLGEHLDGPALYRIVNVDAGGPGLHPAAGSAFAADMETEGTAGFPDEPAAAPASSGSGNGARTAVVSRFLAYSLPALAYAEIGGDPDSGSRDVFLETIRSCSRAGLYSEALRLAVRGTKARGRYITPEEIFLLYPRPFLGIVDETSRSEGIPMWLFYALIREESYFSAEVGSSAGAVGLCQLMPSTAADVARRLGIDSYDLTDPGDNVGLGGGISPRSCGVSGASYRPCGPTTQDRAGQPHGNPVSSRATLFWRSNPFRSPKRGTMSTRSSFPPLSMGGCMKRSPPRPLWTRSFRTSPARDPVSY